MQQRKVQSQQSAGCDATTPTSLLKVTATAYGGRQQSVSKQVVEKRCEASTGEAMENISKNLGKRMGNNFRDMGHMEMT